MYKHNQKTQCNGCLICLQPIYKDISFVHLVKNLPVCINCLSQFELLNLTVDFHHHPLTILYKYNEFFQSLLYQYKGLYDYALKDTFLCLLDTNLKQRYQNFIITPIPSFQDDNVLRGFAPMEEIAKTLSSQVFNGLYKKEKYKQSELSFQERKQVYRKIGIKHQEQLYHKDVLIIDDVLTSGSTMKACLDLVMTCYPRKVELLVLSTKKDQKELLML